MPDGFKTSFTAAASIKLVIWDLDDTFWKGTLSEGGVTLIERNIEIVKTLTDRGIMSSIASKNDHAAVKQVLSEAGIWNYFIFPQISWHSKGGSITNLIEQTNLRPDNVIFIDDNPINIEEIRFQHPTMMVAMPEQILPSLLSLKETKGKDDRIHSRLKQYKQLEKKAIDRTETTLSNENFLRQSNIKLHFEYDVEQYLERILELINRSNQLNYTKVRLESDKEIQKFKNILQRHDIFSAAIFAADRYGEHGLIGFYMQQKNDRINTLLHYVWSCRMMNTGLEQYVYERLGEPAITVVGPISNPIKIFPEINWIQETTSLDAQPVGDDARLLLIGSCDLTAVASYCSRNRSEYVNGFRSGVMTRYDDFGFILGDATKIEHSKALEKIPTWSKVDFFSFRRDLAESDTLIVSLSAAIKGDYLLTNDGVAVRMHPEGLGYYVDIHPQAEFLRGHRFYRLSPQQKAEFLHQSLDFIEAAAGQAKHRFLLGANTRDVGAPLSRRNFNLLTTYNAACAAFCRANTAWHFVSINDVVASEKLIDDRHYTRTAYFDVANYVKKHSSGPGSKPRKKSVPNSNFAAAVRSGQRKTRLTLFGEKQGILAHVKRAIKLTPLSALVKPKRDALLDSV